ncbi:hypothetical protein CC86DRAFT_416221 [Ophiobolus disseminans]|uniref:Protein kinase domain-containing protein n=1 Tax=Ophiobolus disseminans TaxID=1469910 RepID=A0A6A6ZZZ3_9PLEO|nr:hypothetical protein CC86DRAFT_416221 [Ophiobolus disseminans]
MSGLELVALAMGAVGFVKTVLDVWDGIEKKRQEHATSGEFAKELEIFGVADRRKSLGETLELAQMIVRDRTVQKDKKIELADSFKQLDDLLEAIPHATDAAIKLVASKIYLVRRGTAIRNLKGKVTALDEKISSFHQTVMRLRAIVQSDSSLLLDSQDFTFIGEKPAFAKIGEISFTIEASYLDSGKTDMTTEEVLLEKISYGNGPKDAILRSARILATKLSPARTAWNIPRLIGYRDDQLEHSVQLIFGHPFPGKTLISLAYIYSDGIAEPSLNVRVRLCSQLAVAVLQTHKLGLVHKHIRPGNLLIAFEKASNGGINEGALFLAGWQNARLIEGATTTLIGEKTVSKVIYQHPERRVENGRAKDSYSIDHDVYSLGVCMLELLTWDTLTQPGQGEFDDVVLSDAYKRTFEDLGFHKSITTQSSLDADDDGPSLAELYTHNAEQVKKTLEVMAQTLVAKKAGETMARLVYRCLSKVIPSSKERPEVEETGQVAERFANDILDDFNRLLAVL